MRQLFVGSCILVLFGGLAYAVGALMCPESPDIGLGALVILGAIGLLFLAWALGELFLLLTGRVA